MNFERAVAWSIKKVLGMKCYHAADGTTDCVGLEGRQGNARLLINICNIDLDGSVILGVNDTVAGRARETEKKSTN